MTKIQMKNHLIYRLKRITGKDVDIADVKVDLDVCIDTALDTLWLRYPWHQRNKTTTFTTTSGDSLYSLLGSGAAGSSDVAHLKALNYGDDNLEITIKSREFVNYAFSGLVKTGYGGIRFATIEGEDDDGDFQIELHPTPSNTWTVNYWYLKKLGSYTDVPFPGVVLLGAIATWRNGSPDGDPLFENAVELLIQSDAPYVGTPARWPTDFHIENKMSFLRGLR